ncbi:MAG: Fic family protein [Chloroflexota bacterium]
MRSGIPVECIVATRGLPDRPESVDALAPFLQRQREGAECACLADKPLTHPAAVAAARVQAKLEPRPTDASKADISLYLVPMDASRFVAPQMGRVAPVISPSGRYEAFLPAPMPRDVELSRRSVAALSRADQALGRLAGAGRHLANPHLLVQPYLTREAVSSTRIEGTQASLSEVFDADAEAPAAVREDVREVQNYVRAMRQGLGLLSRLPISKRLVAELHGTLLQGVRGKDKTPGQFRTIQNFIGSPDDRPQTALFVPPPAGEVMEVALADWERFAHEDDSETPLLVRCALLHYQFETIHPFLDGNGRMGRLLIVLFLVEQEALPSPLLYLSSYFEEHRDDYNGHLQAVRERGTLDDWVTFFLVGVESQANDAVTRAERLADLNRDYHARLRGMRGRAREVVDLLFENPLVSTPLVVERIGVTNQGAQHLLRTLQEAGIIESLGTPRVGVRTRWRAPAILAAIGGE